MWIDPEVFLSAIFLHVPMIGIPCVRSVFDPDPSLRINIPFFPFLGAIGHRVFLDNLFSLLVLFKLGFERDRASCWQSRFINLLFNLVWELFRHLARTFRKGQGRPVYLAIQIALILSSHEHSILLAEFTAAENPTSPCIFSTFRLPYRPSIARCSGRRDGASGRPTQFAAFHTEQDHGGVPSPFARPIAETPFPPRSHRSVASRPLVRRSRIVFPHRRSGLPPELLACVRQGCLALVQGSTHAPTPSSGPGLRGRCCRR